MSESNDLDVSPRGPPTSPVTPPTLSRMEDVSVFPMI